MCLALKQGEANLADVFRKEGFTHLRRVAETPFNSGSMALVFTFFDEKYDMHFVGIGLELGGVILK